MILVNLVETSEHYLKEVAGACVDHVAPYVLDDRFLVRGPVPQMQVLSPTRDDIRYLKRFLDETAERSNRRIGERLAELLTVLHAADPGLFVPLDAADMVTRTFGVVLTIAGYTGTLPPEAFPQSPTAMRNSCLSTVLRPNALYGGWG